MIKNMAKANFTRGSESTVAIAGWAQIRRRILDRDNHACRICGRGVESCLNVHHIEYDRTKNEDDDLVTLCGTCHKAVHNEGYKPSLYEDYPVPWGEHPTGFY